jgi:uncharacterized FlgJ-related protein
MRTNIVIDPALMDTVMSAGVYKTKKEAVEAGLTMLARQAAYREVRKWRGKLHWTGHDEPWSNEVGSQQWSVQMNKTVYQAGAGAQSAP